MDRSHGSALKTGGAGGGDLLPPPLICRGGAGLRRTGGFVADVGAGGFVVDTGMAKRARPPMRWRWQFFFFFYWRRGGWRICFRSNQA